MTTNIEWARNPDGSKGETWPVVTGCTPVSEGCRNCYAARMAATRLRDHPRYRGLATFHNGKAKWTGEVRLNHDVLEQPLHWKKPRRVFVASMGDLFHEDVPDDFIIEVFVKMGEAPQHTFQILTKQAARMDDFISKSTWGMSPLFNVWLGVSVENQAAADERIPYLLQTPAAVRFVSVEPMLEAVDLRNLVIQHSIDGNHDMLDALNGMAWFKRTCMTNPHLAQSNDGINWVICGGESGPGTRPMHPGWARSLRDQCQAAGVPYFFKQHGAWLHGSQFPLASPWTELQRDGARVHGRPINWHYESNRTYRWPDGSTSYRIGKKAAGHLLDGRTWQEFPR